MILKKDLLKLYNHKSFNIDSMDKEFKEFNEDLVESVMEFNLINEANSEEGVNIIMESGKVKNIILNINTMISSTSKWIGKTFNWVKSFVGDSVTWVKDNRPILNSKAETYNGVYKVYDINLMQQASISLNSAVQQIKYLGDNVTESEKFNTNDFDIENVFNGMSKKDFKRKVYKGKSTTIPSGDDILGTLDSIHKTYSTVMKSQKTLLNTLKKAKNLKKDSDPKITNNARLLISYINKIISAINLLMSNLNKYLRSLMSLSRSIVKSGE